MSTICLILISAVALDFGLRIIKYAETKDARYKTEHLVFYHLFKERKHKQKLDKLPTEYRNESDPFSAYDDGYFF